MAAKLMSILVILLLVNTISSHILIGRDITQRKIFRTKSGGEFFVSSPLTKRQKRMIADEMLKSGIIQLMFRRKRAADERN